MTRNENLAHIFYRLTLIEAYGTGVPKILRSYDDYPKKPNFEASENAFKTTLPNKNIENVQNLLSEKEQIVIDLAAREKEISRKDVEEALKVSQTMSGRIIKHLVNKGILQAVGGGKNTRYILIK